MHTRLTLVVAGLLSGLAASSAYGQTAAITVNRGLAFGAVSPLGSVTVPGTTPPDSRAAWVTIVLGLNKKSCKATVLITVPSTITRTVAPSATVATSPFVATLVNPDGTTANVPIGTSTSFRFFGTHELYVGTTGAFNAARAGTYTGTFTVAITPGGGC